MFTALFQGIAILFIHGWQVPVLIVSGLGFGSITVLLLFDKRKYDERVVYVLLLGFVFIGIAAPFLKLIGLLNVYIVAAVDLFGMAAFITLIRRGAFLGWNRDTLRKYVSIPAAFFGVFLLIRLGYIQGLLLPPFSDSAAHFRDLGGLLGLEYTRPFTWNNIFPLYHYGFHGITAWGDILTGDTDPLTMAVTAHFFLGLLPAAVYLMALAFSNGDVPSSVFGALLAGLGWVMPAHAVNFGKYPSLTAVCLLPLLLGLFHLSNKSRDINRWAWRVYFVLVTFALIWIHSRLLVVMAFFYFAYYAARFVEGKFPKGVFEIGTGVLTFLVLLWALIVNKTGDGDTPFRYYLNKYDNTTFLVAALLPFAFRRHAALVLQWIAVIALLIIATGAALPEDVYTYDLTLLDEPFFEITLFLPLAALGALGLNSLEKLFPAREVHYREISLFLMLLVIANGALSPQPWSPMKSSNYVSRDDVEAFAWIEDNIPDSSTLIIAGIEKNDGYMQPADGGAWVNVLAGNPVSRINYEFPWDSTEARNSLCTTGDVHTPQYVYVGTKNNSFNISSCEPAGLTAVFCLSQAKIFELNCGK